MTKNPRNHREWTNEELEQDSAGYLAAQEAYREDREKADHQRREKDDLERYTEAFVEAGGNRSDAPAAFKAERNRRAAEAASQADQAAAERTRRTTLGRL